MSVQRPPSTSLRSAARHPPTGWPPEVAAQLGRAQQICDGYAARYRVHRESAEQRKVMMARCSRLPAPAPHTRTRSLGFACYDAVLAERKPAPQEATVPASSAAGAQPTAEERFGLRGEVAREELDRAAGAVPKIEHLPARIAAIDHLPHGQFVLRLDNGQVWTQKIRESIGSSKVGDTVTIRAGTFGSYRLSAGSTRSTHVQRTE